MRLSLPRFVTSWKGSRSRSNWRRPASTPSGCGSCRPCSRIDFGCCGKGDAPRLRGTEPWLRRSTGAMKSCRNTNARSCAALVAFAGPFTLASACAVLVDSGIAAPNVVEGVANLVAKSLVSADVSGAVAHYRLLDTTRAYALGKLKEAREDEQVARLHAEFFRDKFVAAAIGRPQHPSVAEMHEYGREIDNVRSAIDWSFSKGGEPAIGVV